MTGSRAVVLSLVASSLASLGLVALYVIGGNPQAEGILLGLALGGLGAAFVIWSITLLDAPVEVEERHPLRSDGAKPSTAEAREAGDVTRRTFLTRLLLGAGGLLAAALAIPVLSLGPQPGRSLFRTAWSAGARLAGPDGAPIRPDDLVLDSVRTVFPQDRVGTADAATLLIRVRPEDLRLPAERAAWAPGGVIGYSKICTHAGCPVGLYRAQDHALLCPCHQSTFDVLEGARPTSGPAARPLPQLPITVDEEGYLVAMSDFPEPIGPSFWDVTHDA